MGNHLAFTGPAPREQGVLPARILNRAEGTSELEIRASDLSAAEIAALITRADKLTALTVCGHALTPAILQAIAGRDRLQTFHWSDAGALGDADAAHFRELGHLRVFHLGHADITTAFAETLADRRHLWQVALPDTLVDDAVTGVLAGFAELRVVSLARTFVTGASLGALAATQCAELDLSGCDIDGPGLGEALTRLPHLKVLHLDGTKLGDEQAHLLIAQPHLASLGLGGTRITDQALGFFAYLPQRTRLRLTGSAVTAAGLDQLRAKRPDLLLEWAEGRAAP